MVPKMHSILLVLRAISVVVDDVATPCIAAFDTVAAAPFVVRDSVDVVDVVTGTVAVALALVAAIVFAVE